jgi:glycine/D-amino acid oxidase-like deaminating enzyme
MASDSPDTRNIIIIGGGIIGCTTAYYISRNPSFSSSTSVTILEASAHGAAQGASGKAGGLVSKNAYPEELVAVSFQEVSLSSDWSLHGDFLLITGSRSTTKHVRLAEEHNGQDRWGWRFVGCGSWTGRGETIDDNGTNSQDGQKESLKKSLGGIDATSHMNTKATGLPDDLTWVKKNLTDSYSPWTSAEDTAQVHPYLFTTSILELAKDKGVRFIQGRATSIETSDGQTTGVTYTATDDDKQKETIPATHVILCAGAWSNTFSGISIPVSAVRAHSITIRPPVSAAISPYVLFTQISLPPAPSSRRSAIVEPEIYARPDNEVYVCGPGGDAPLPETVDGVIPDEKECDKIWQHVASISQELRDGTVQKRQACFLPVVTFKKKTPGRKATAIQGPVIGEAHQFAKGLFVATGHTCWVRILLLPHRLYLAD